MKKPMIVIIILILAAVGCIFMYRYFMEQKIREKGGMENPCQTSGSENEEPIEYDGDYSYVDNEALMNRIAGVWISTDERCRLQINDDNSVTLSMDGETVLDGSIDFTYLQPGNERETELTLYPEQLISADGTVIGTAVSFYHVPSGDEDSLHMEISHEQRTCECGEAVEGTVCSACGAEADSNNIGNELIIFKADFNSKG